MPVEIRNMRLWLGQNYPLWLVQWLRTRRSPLRSDFVINVGMWDRHVVTRSDRLISLKYSGFLPGQIDFAQVLWFPHSTCWFRSSTLVSSQDRLISLKYSGFLTGQVDFAQVLWFPHWTGWFRSSTLVSSQDRLISLKYSGFLTGWFLVFSNSKTK